MESNSKGDVVIIYGTQTLKKKIIICLLRNNYFDTHRIINANPLFIGRKSAFSVLLLCAKQPIDQNKLSDLYDRHNFIINEDCDLQVIIERITVNYGYWLTDKKCERTFLLPEGSFQWKKTVCMLLGTLWQKKSIVSQSP